MAFPLPLAALQRVAVSKSVQCQRFGEQPGEPVGFPTASQIPETGIASWLSLEIRDDNLLGGLFQVADSQLYQPNFIQYFFFGFFLLLALVGERGAILKLYPETPKVGNAVTGRMASHFSISAPVTKDTAKCMQNSSPSSLGPIGLRTQPPS